MLLVFSSAAPTTMPQRLEPVLGALLSEPKVRQQLVKACMHMKRTLVLRTLVRSHLHMCWCIATPLHPFLYFCLELEWLVSGTMYIWGGKPWAHVGKKRVSFHIQYTRRHMWRQYQWWPMSQCPVQWKGQLWSATIMKYDIQATSVI